MRCIQAILLTTIFAAANSYVIADESDGEKTPEEIAEELQEERDEERAENDRNSPAPKRRAAIEEITVTAQKREQKLFDVPMSISAFSGESLKEMGAENLMDVAVATPGFSVSEDGPGVQSIQLRGIASAFGKSTAGYQFDNVPLTSAPGTQPDVPSYDLASIEILRGPQGTLYGEGSMGGTIKLGSNKPDFEGWEGTAMTGFSVTKDGAPSYDLKTAINMPLTDSQAMRLVLTKVEIGGYIDQTEFAIDNHNFAKKVNGRLKYRYEPNDFFMMSAMVMANETEAGSSNAADENYERRDQADVGVDDSGQIYNLDFDFDFDSWNVLIASSIFRRDIDVVFDIRDGVINAVEGSVPVPIPGFDPGSLVSGTLGGTPAQFNNVNDTFANEIRFSGSPWPELFWTAGTYYKTGDDNQIIFSEIEAPDGSSIQPLVDTNKQIDSEVYSLFGQVEYDFTSWLNVALGTRYFREDVITDIDGTVITNDVTTYTDQTFSTVSSKFTMSLRSPDDWGIANQAMGYFTVGEGFRSGGANIFYEGADDLTAQNGHFHLTNGVPNQWLAKPLISTILTNSN